MSTNHAIGRRSLALLLLAGIMVAAATLLSYEINEPFIGHQDFNTAYMSTAAANHLRYGLGVTRFGLIMDNGPVAPANFVYYSDHPPLIPLIAAVSFAVFGEHAWSARLLPIAFSLGSVVLVYLLGRRLHGRTVGLVAAGIFGLLPMTGYFGRMLDHEAPTNFFVLASVLAYGHWRTSRSTTSFVAMVAALVAGALCGWPAY